MSQQDPNVYNLKYFGNAPFWDGAGQSPWRTLLMPLANPAEFLGFGGYGPSDTVHFVVRGRVREHLGNFISRMEEAGASVELYQRVPLPWPLVRRYLSDDPFQGLETDPPPPNPGSVTLGGGAELATASSTSSPSLATYTPSWPQDSFEQQTFIMPLPGQLEFLALGVCKKVVEPPETGTGNVFVFAGRGEVGTHLGDFLVRMRQAGNTVKFCDWPSLDFLQRYVTEYYPEAYEQRSQPPSNGQPSGGTSTLLAA
jgi:hypothetical protein